MSETALEKGFPPLPDYLRKLSSAEHAEAYGQLSRTDLGISRLTLGQGETPAVKEGTVPQGAMFLSVTSKIIPPKTPFMVLRRETIYYKFKSSNPKEAKTIEFITKDPLDPRILKINGLDFTELPDGKKIKPSVTEFLNFYIVLPETFSNEPVLMSFKRSSLPAGRNFTRKLLRILPDKSLPLYGALFMLGQPVKDKYDNYALTIIPCGFTPEKFLEKAKTMSLIAKNMAEFAMDATELHEADLPEAEAPDAEDPPPPTQNQGASFDAEDPPPPKQESPSPWTNPELPDFLAPAPGKAMTAQEKAKAAASQLSAMPGSAAKPETPASPWDNIPF